ncbi:MAG TPA: RagB/SusD family nutrient uptake outer membrane protein, partial [Puia sp.]
WQLQPSQLAIANWNNQVQSNNFPFDARGLFSWRMVGGKPVIMKYLYNYIDPATGLPISAISNSGQDQSKWFLYRAADLHLHFAEAANRDGRHKLAYALVNLGITTTFTDSTTAANNTNTQQTHDQPPYDFDGRNGTPIIHANWYRNAGIRGRAFLKAGTLAPGDSTLTVEDQIISESALETAYEGNRWSDLVRIAMRRNDPSFLANRIYNKLLADGNGQASAVQTKLMDPANWFLPFKLQ